MKISFIFALLLSGCASISNETKSFADFDTERLCTSAKWVYATHNEDKVIIPYLEETKKREILTREEFETVFKKKAAIGDSFCYLYATWGHPDMFHVSKTENITYVQYIYRGIYSTTYVYTENGKITSIQY